MARLTARVSRSLALAALAALGALGALGPSCSRPQPAAEPEPVPSETPTPAVVHTPSPAFKGEDLSALKGQWSEKCRLKRDERGGLPKVGPVFGLRSSYSVTGDNELVWTVNSYADTECTKWIEANRQIFECEPKEDAYETALCTEKKSEWSEKRGKWVEKDNDELKISVRVLRKKLHKAQKLILLQTDEETDDSVRTELTPDK